MSRFLVGLGLLVAGVLLVLVFVVLGFPVDLYRERVALEASRATGARVEIGELGVGMSWFGPVLSVQRIRASWPTGLDLELEHARVRPAWSFGWLSGNPALYLDVAGPVGSAVGALSLGPPGWDGRLREIQLEQLPLAELLAGFELAGIADVEADLVNGPDGPEGHLELAARSGSIGLPDFPIAIPYDTVKGSFVFEAQNVVRVETFDLQGPLASIVVTGQIGPARVLERAPLDLSAELTVTDRSFRRAAASFGALLDDEGRGRYRIGGTVARPDIR